MEFCCDKYGDLLDEVAELKRKLKAAEVERDAALVQMRENAAVIDSYELNSEFTGDDA